MEWVNNLFFWNNTTKILLVSIFLIFLTSCEVYQTVYPRVSTTDTEKIGRSGMNIERQTTVRESENLTAKYLDHRIQLENDNQFHNTINRYVTTLGFIIFLFYSAYLTYKFKVNKLKIFKKDKS